MTETTKLDELKAMRDYLLNLDSESGEGKLVDWAIKEIERLQNIVTHWEALHA